MDDKGTESRQQTNDTNILFKFFQSFKQLSFHLIIQLLRFQTIPAFLKYIFLIISTVQMTKFQFNATYLHLYKSEIADYIELTNRYTYLQKFFSKDNYDVYIIAFFIISAFVVAVFLMLFYILYMIDTKLNFSLLIMQAISEVLILILCIPIIDFYLLNYYCEKDGAKYSHKYFTNTECYAGNHIFYAVLGGILGFMLILYVFLTTLLLFENRPDVQDQDTKIHTRIDVFIYFYKLLMIINYNLEVDMDVQIGLNFALSFIIFELYSLNLVNSNVIFNKIYTIMYSINLWSSLSLFLARITYNYTFDGAAILYLLGIVLILILLNFRIDSQYEIFLIDVNQFQIISIPQKQIIYLMLELCKYKTDQHTTILLDGFLNNHRLLCVNPQCPSQKRCMKTNTITKQLRDNGESEQYIMLLAVIQTLYYDTLQKFPNSTKIRIQYALYLFTYLDSKQQALQELINCESEGPALDEQFVIYRFKSIIENELMNNQKINSKNEESVEMLNELSVRNHVFSCKSNIEKSAQLHFDFWSLLTENQQDISKLSELGFKITIANATIDEQWSKLIKMKANIPSLMRIYSKYQIEILNDKQQGKIILQKLNDYNKQKNHSSSELNQEPLPCIVISAEDYSMGLITNINLAATQYLGYNKIEVLNKKIQDIIPNIYGKYHDQFLERYLQTLTGRVINQDRLLPARNKNGYMQQSIAHVRHVPSLIHGMQFIGTLKAIRSLDQICYILVDPEGNIEDVSATCSNQLSLNIQKISKRKINFINAVPNWADNLKKFQQKNGLDIVMKDFSSSKNKINVNLQIEKIEFKNIFNQGYMIKLKKYRDQLKDQNSSMNIKDGDLTQPPTNLGNPDDSHLSVGSTANHNIMISKYVINKHVKQIDAHLGVNYDPFNGKYVGLVEFGQPNVNKQFASMEYNDADQNFILGKSVFIQSKIQAQNDQAIKIETVQYGLNISVKRLFNNKVQEIEDQEDEANEEEEQQKSQKSENEIEESLNSKIEDDTMNLANILKKKKLFVQFIQTSGFLKSRVLNTFKIVAIIFICALLICSLCNYFLILFQFQDVGTRFDIIKQSNDMLTEGQHILSIIHNLKKANDYSTVKSAISSIEQPAYDSGYNDSQLKELQSTWEVFEETALFLESKQQMLSLSSEHSKILNDKIIKMKSSYNNNAYVENYLHLANSQIIGKAKDVKQSKNYNNQQNDAYYFLEFNLLNDYHIQVQRSSELYIAEFLRWIDLKNRVFIGIFVFMFVVFIVFVVISYFFYKAIQTKQKEILDFFTEIPKSKVKRLQTQAEMFLQVIQGGNEDDLTSEQYALEYEDEEESMNPQSSRKKGKKTLKQKNKGCGIFYIPILLLILIVQLYIISTIGISYFYTQKLEKIANEFYSTALVQNRFQFHYNAAMQALIDDTITVEKKSAYLFLREQTPNLYKIDNEMNVLHGQNFESQKSTTYNKEFTDIMIKNNCLDFQTKKVLTKPCDKFANGLISEGLTVVISRQIELQKQIFYQYEQIYNSNRSATQKKTEYTKILYSNLVKNTSTIQQVFMKEILADLVKEFQKSNDAEHKSLMTYIITLCIVNMLLVILIFLFVWFPILNQIDREGIRIRSMVLMIPIDVCNSVEPIRQVLQKYQQQQYKN